MNTYQMLIPILTPILIALVKWGIPRVPGKWLPVLAPVVGGLLDAGTAWATGTQANPGLAAALGSAGVGVREILDQWKKGNGSNGNNGSYAFALAVVVGMTGCAHFTTTQEDVSNEQTGVRTITTEATATTFFAGRSDLANWKASQTDKTQGASVGRLTQETDASTNVMHIVEAVTAAAIKAATGK